MKREVVESDGAPSAIGPYSQAISYGGVLYCSGALPMDAGSGELVVGLTEQVDKCLENLDLVCRAAGTSIDRALMVQIFTVELQNFASINAAYERWFRAQPPARAAVGISSLPKGASVEMTATVALD